MSFKLIPLKPGVEPLPSDPNDNPPQWKKDKEGRLVGRVVVRLSSYGVVAPRWPLKRIIFFAVSSVNSLILVSTVLILFSGSGGFENFTSALCLIWAIFIAPTTSLACLGLSFLRGYSDFRPRLWSAAILLVWLVTISLVWGVIVPWRSNALGDFRYTSADIIEVVDLDTGAKSPVPQPVAARVFDHLSSAHRMLGGKTTSAMRVTALRHREPIFQYDVTISGNIVVSGRHYHAPSEVTEYFFRSH